MPGYGVTQVKAGMPIAYDDWVQAASDFIDTERERDSRPIVLYGLSAGGMLTYHAAALNGHVAGIVGMTFLDQRVRQVAEETAYNVPMGRVGLPLVRLAAKVGLGSVRVPMRMAGKMYALVNDKAAMKSLLS